MASTTPLKQLPSMKEWMVEADPPKEASPVKKMNGRPLLLLSNKITHNFNKCMTASGALKKYIVKM